MEQDGGNGMKLLIGADMEACGDQAAAASNQFAANLRWSQAGKLVITSIVVQSIYHLIFLATLFLLMF